MSEYAVFRMGLIHSILSGQMTLGQVADELEANFQTFPQIDWREVETLRALDDKLARESEPAPPAAV